jgi:dTDP-4-dehydrorhamnose reductase
MRVLVTGRSGQLAVALSKLSRRGGVEFLCYGRPQLELLDPKSVQNTLDEVNPTAVINAAAYTSVDKAEHERDIAQKVNAEGPRRIAHACMKKGIPLVHISTDYVFDGPGRRPLRPDDPPSPRSVYGSTKAAGEDAVRRTHPRHLIVRTAWLFGREGQNFMKTMLRLGRERETVSVVNDQIGSPTYVVDLASGLESMLKTVLLDPSFRQWGTYHVTNAGSASWYEFAAEIFQQAAKYGQKPPLLSPIPTSEFPTDAKRPEYSVLDASSSRSVFGIDMPDWKDAVGRCVNKILSGSDRIEKEPGL